MIPTPKLLADRTYDIEFRGYLSNHAKHAIVALDKLDASNDRIQEWWDGYTSTTPYGWTLHKVDQQWDTVKACTIDEWKAWRGKKMHWQEMCMFMQQELRSKDGNDNIQQLIRTYAPPLLPGMAGGLTHGLIHLGWAIDGDSEWMIIEGLAYLNFCNVGGTAEPSSTAIVAETTPLETLTRISNTWEDDNLADTWVASVKEKYGQDFHPELVPAGFQWDLAKVLEEPHDIATKVPQWLVETPLTELWEQLYRTVVLIFLATRDAEGNGNFLVLHAITCLWGLEHVLSIVGDDEVSRTALQQYFTTIVCLLAASSSGIPSAAVLMDANSEYPASSTETPDWKPIEDRGMAEEEEHNIKLVYVCRELWKRYGHWRGFSDAAQAFTLTPDIGPSATAFKA